MVMDESEFQLVAVAVDKDKSSQNALKWAVENIVQRGQTITLIHVKTKNSNSLPASQEEIALGYKTPTDQQTKEMFLPFRCYCTRKDVQCRDVVLEDSDITKAIVEFAAHAAIEKLVVGAASKGGFVR
ncbi:putative rossmann-like alpha/beta/alpha sandwich protein [Dioscorea sansibarensis]